MPTLTESDPVTQAAERDVDNWLFRVFYVAKYEAAVLVQIALNKTSGGKGNGDGNFKIGILADAGHRALATGIAAALPSFYQQPSSTEIIYMLLASFGGVSLDEVRRRGGITAK